MAISYKQAVPACLATLTGAALGAVFIAPFYGALEPVIADTADGQSIIIEDFDYTEPEQNSGQVQPATENEGAKTASEQDNVPEQVLEPALPETTPVEDEGALAEAEREAHLVPEDQPMQMVYGAIVVAAGRLEGSGRIITLDDIVVTEVNEQCHGDNLMSWNCGIHARTAFRSWLGSKTLNCRLPLDDSLGIPVTTDCELGSENAALWLVRNGWVKAVETGAYAELGKEAENAKRGIWGNKPVSMMPELLPLPQPSMQIPPAIPNNNSERPAGYFPPAPQN